MLGVIFYLSKDKRKLIIFLSVLIISLLAVLCIIMPDELLFGNKELIYLPDISKAETLAVINKGFTWWRAITDLTILLSVFTTFVLLVKGLRSEHQKKIIIILSGSALVIMAGIYDQFVDLGLINSDYTLPYALFVFYMILNFVPYLFLLAEVEENILISQREKKWRALVNDVNLIVVGLNRMGHVDFINPYFLNLTGYEEDEVLGKDWFEFFIPPGESFNVQGAFIEALDSDFHSNYMNPILTKSREERMIRWFNVRTRDINGIITGSLSIGLDITSDKLEKEAIIAKLKTAEGLIEKLKQK